MKPSFYLLIALTALALSPGCKPSTPDSASPVEKAPAAYGVDGTPLYPLEEPEGTVARKDSALQVATTHFLSDSLDLDHIIWYGRRLAYLYRYEEAIDVYTNGLIHHPGSAHLLRHRGHRYISIRQFDRAIDDLQKAAQSAKNMPVEIEPDGIPNKLNQPLSTLQFNIYYHLALAHYLQGDFEAAALVCDTCMVYSTNPDLLVATTDWYYMTLRRMGEKNQADGLLTQIGEDLEIIENDSYFKRIMMYKGKLKPDDLLEVNQQEEATHLDMVTQGYGVGNWYLCESDTIRALDIYQKMIATRYWPAFGYIAAECDLQRLK